MYIDLLPQQYCLGTFHAPGFAWAHNSNASSNSAVTVFGSAISVAAVVFG
jgi:hypothetical protein